MLRCRNEDIKETQVKEYIMQPEKKGDSTKIIFLTPGHLFFRLWFSEGRMFGHLF